jgi:O-antigen/teichoic acid export membrane protein
MSLSAFFTVSATPVGVLRLFDRFGLLAMTDPIGPTVRLVLCAACYYFGWSIWAFAAAHLASSAVDRLITVWMGWRELRRRDLTPTWQDVRADKSEGHPGLWKFALANNGRVSLGVITKQSDDLIVAAFAGPIGVALWKIAKRVSSVLSGPARLFVFSVFPQLAKLWSARDYRGFRRLVMRGSATSTAGALLVLGLFAVLGHWLLDLFFFKASQRDFVGVFVPALLLMGSRVFTTLMAPFLPALTAMGRAWRNLKLAFFMALITVPGMIVLTWQFGVIGAGWSRIAAEALSAAVFGWAVIHTTNKRIVNQAATEAAGATAAADVKT